MILRTWSGSRIDTRDYSSRIWFSWALGWIRRLAADIAAIALLLAIAIGAALLAGCSPFFNIKKSAAPDTLEVEIPSAYRGSMHCPAGSRPIAIVRPDERTPLLTCRDTMGGPAGGGS